MGSKICLTLFLFSGFFVQAQESTEEFHKPHDMLMGLYADLVKTDNTKLFNKAQGGFEFNYFASRQITATAGFEVWTGDEFSFVIGARWYPSQDTFIRVRGLVGANDFSVGGGWVKPIEGNFKFEAIADFYFQIDFSIRAGFVYSIR